jgi:hypothetical protein
MSNESLAPFWSNGKVKELIEELLVLGRNNDNRFFRVTLSQLSHELDRIERKTKEMQEEQENLVEYKVQKGNTNKIKANRDYPKKKQKKEKR